MKGNCSICNRNKSQIFTMEMTRFQNIEKNGKCKHGHCSPISSSAWTDLNTACSVLKLHDMCDRNGCKCQNQLTVLPKQYMLPGESIKSKIKHLIGGTEKTGKKFLKPALNIAGPYIVMDVAAKTKNPEIGKATGSLPKSISGGEVLSSTDMCGNGLRSRVMWF